MLHVSWKELATATDKIKKLSLLAKALRDAGFRQQTNVFFEFQSPSELEDFCNAIQAMQIVKGIKQLETRKRNLQKEIEDLIFERDQAKLARREKKIVGQKS